nr:hypothetical protein [Rhizobium leguminosarum]
MANGSVRPAANLLVANSDYIEVLTDIDTQSPIPEVVKERRTNPNFSFGSRFNDQMLRTYALENDEALGLRFAALAAAVLTKTERRFLAAGAAITLIDVPREHAALLCRLNKVSEGVLLIRLDTRSSSVECRRRICLEHGRH